MSVSRTHPRVDEFDHGPLWRSRQEDWAFSAARDLRECVRQLVVDVEAAHEWETEPGSPRNAYLGTFAYATKTFGAALLLCDRGYGEQAGMLNRSLFEHMVVAWWMPLQDDQDELIAALGRHHEHARVLYDRAAEQHPEMDLSARSGVADLSDERIAALDREFGRFGGQWHGKRVDELVREVEAAGAERYAGYLWALFRFVNHTNNYLLHHSSFSLVEAIEWTQGVDEPTLRLGPSHNWSDASLWAAHWCYGLLVFAILRQLSPHRADAFREFFDDLAPRYHTVTASQAAGVGRNDPCPCGHGKKFKHCHCDFVLED